MTERLMPCKLFDTLVAHDRISDKVLLFAHCGRRGEDGAFQAEAPTAHDVLRIRPSGGMAA